MAFAGLSNNRILEAMSLTDPGKAFILKRKSQVYFNLPLYCKLRLPLSFSLSSPLSSSSTFTPIPVTSFYPSLPSSLCSCVRIDILRTLPVYPPSFLKYLPLLIGANGLNYPLQIIMFEF